MKAFTVSFLSVSNGFGAGFDVWFCWGRKGASIGSLRVFEGLWVQVLWCGFGIAFGLPFARRV